MESQHGVKGIIHNGIFITEKNIPEATVVQHLEVEISRQNANLKEIKKLLSAKAKEHDTLPAP